MLPGKNKDFDGPKTNVDIFRKISSEARENGMELSSDDIKNIVGLFFYRILSHMRIGHFIRIAELGDFGMSKKEKNKREKEEKRMFYNRVLYDRQRNKRIYHNQKLREEWKAHCEKMKSKGLKPWSYVHWKFIFKKRKIRKISERILVLGSK